MTVNGPFVVFSVPIASYHLGTFKYLKMLREGGKGVCSNRQSTVIWGEESWPSRHITFVVAKKLNLQFILLFLCILGLVESVK